MVVLFAAAITGVLLARISASQLLPFAIMVVAFVALVAGRGNVSWLTIALATIAVFCFLHQRHAHFETEDSIAHLVDHRWRPVVLQARLLTPFEKELDTLAQLHTESHERQYRSTADVEITAYRREGVWTELGGRARLVVAGTADHLLPGDLVRLDAEAERIKPPTNPGEFDVRDVYSVRQQATRVKAASPDHIRLVQPGPISAARVLGWMGNRGEQVLQRLLGEETSALAAAIVLGRREAVPEELRIELLETGTIHLLAVSGLHLGILAAALWLLLTGFGLNPTARTVLVIAACAVYMALTGGRPPVLRAFLLISVWMVGTRLGRPRDGLNALATVGFLLLIYNPAIVTRPGPQLSFLAVAVLLWASRSTFTAPAKESDPINELIASTRPAPLRYLRARTARLWSVVAISGWVTLFTTPLVWHQFHVISPVAVVANVVISPLLSIALITGMATALCGSVSDILGAPFAFVTHGSLEAIVVLVRLFASLPYGHFWFPSPPGWLVLSFYATVTLAFWRSLRPGFFVAIFVIWTSIALAIATRPMDLDDAELRATFVDVGHGTSVLLQTADSVWLYDAGRMGDPLYSSRSIEGVLWSERIHKIDTLCISHADADHYNAVEQLAQRFRIGRVVVPADLFEATDPPLQRLRQQLQARGIAIEAVSAGTTLRMGPVDAQVLHPPAQWQGASDNAQSLVLCIKVGDRVLVLPGDLEGDGTELVLASPPPPRDGVLMAPHHGSLQQSPAPLLAWCRPRIVVISGGERAARREAVQAAGQMGAEVFVTSRDGAIRTTFRRFSSSIAVETYSVDDGWHFETSTTTRQ